MVLVDLARRNLLRGRISDLNRQPHYPPWARVAQFSQQCTRCLQCALSCRERIIGCGDGGYPEIDFSRGGCSLCGDCVRACPSAALSFDERVPWQHRAQVGEQCLARKGVTCRSCADVCGERAIRFQMQLGGRSNPKVEQEHCSGCGACIAACPMGCITLGPGASVTPVLSVTTRINSSTNAG